MRSITRLNFEPLEDRSVPATFGTPWPDGSNVTLSFVPDGTDIEGAASNLTSAMLGSASGNAARQTILRAFQSWAANTNVNIGIVGDSGNAFDASGAVQGDSRFGDIRVGGRAWANDVLALTTAFNYFNTESGNIAINTAQSFGYGSVSGAYDLFTAMLQETGHTLGVGNSTDITSVMYEYYQGTRTGLSSGDVASIQSLYGARHQDVFEGDEGNNTQESATRYDDAVTADLTTTGDVDYYRFTVEPGTVMPVIRFQAAGLSLVQAHVQVLDGSGFVVAEGATHDSLHNDITLTVPGSPLGGDYYVRVSSNTSDVFGVGSYRLTVDGSSLGGVSLGGTSTQAVSGDHSSFDSAAVLAQAITSVDNRLDYVANVTPELPNDVTYLRLHSPVGQPGEPLNFVVSVNSTTGNEDMLVKVYDADQQLVDVSVLTDTTGSTVVRVNDARPDTDYFFRVSSASAFRFAVDFTTREMAFDMGSLGGASAGTVQSASLHVVQSQVVHFALTANGDSNASVRMKITDANDNTVFVLTTSGGKSRSDEFFFAAGTYRVEISLVTDPMYFGGPLTYSLCGWGITDPIGAAPRDPSDAPSGGGGGGGGGGPPPPQAGGPTISWTGASPADGSVWF